MEKTIDYQGTSIWYSVEGNGEALLFLHGYLESSDVWDGFSKRFQGEYKVICMDIPGHGRSGVLGEIHEISEMARVVKRVLDEEMIEKVTLFGHSLGGYVVMAFVHQFPELTRGYVLFHSTCFADNEEKKMSRDREISLVACGKKMQIIHTNIPKAFADDNLGKMENQVDRVKKIASSNSGEGIMALLQGMKSRSDHSALLSDEKIPKLIIWGRKDNYIGSEVFEKMIRIAPHAMVIILKNSGHMGFLEEPDCVFTGIIDFLNS